MLCSLREAGGVPREGIHAARIPVIDVALWDVVFTVLGAAAVARWGRWNPWTVVLLALGLSLPAHLLCCVPTRMVTLLTGTPDTGGRDSNARP
jgi:hypothetical protein